MSRTHAGIAAVMFLASASAAAYDTYQDGRITNVTVAADTVLIMLDTGMPDNCGSAVNAVKSQFRTPDVQIEFSASAADHTDKCPIVDPNILANPYSPSSYAT